MGFSTHTPRQIRLGEVSGDTGQGKLYKDRRLSWRLGDAAKEHIRHVEKVPEVLRAPGDETQQSPNHGGCAQLA